MTQENQLTGLISINGVLFQVFKEWPIYKPVDYLFNKEFEGKVFAFNLIFNDSEDVWEAFFTNEKGIKGSTMEEARKNLFKEFEILQKAFGE